MESPWSEMGRELPFESLSFCKHITAPLDAVQSGGGVKSGRLSTVLQQEAAGWAGRAGWEPADIVPCCCLLGFLAAPATPDPSQALPKMITAGSLSGLGWDKATATPALSTA